MIDACVDGAGCNTRRPWHCMVNTCMSWSQEDLQHPVTGLLTATTAKPEWLTLDSICRCHGNNSDDVSPLSSFGDLQNALCLVTDKKKNGSSSKGSYDENEASSAPTSSMTTTGSSSDSCGY